MSAPTSWTHRDARMSDARLFFVYLIRSATGSPLYIGQTWTPEARWRQHQQSKAWWVQFAAHFTQYGPLTYSQARRLEKELIEGHDPLGNQIHTSRYVHPRQRKDAA